MWAFLSSRLRTWIVLAVAVPLFRAIVRRLTESARRRRPDARSTRILGRADSAVTSFADRRARRRRAR